MWTVRLGFLLVLVTSCIDSDLPTCAGLACPIGARCAMIDGRARCAAADNQCSGKAAGAACALPNKNGTCIEQQCVTVVCGDGITDPGVEQCDDGGSIGGDGCSSTCEIERCGNGITDPNESCDCGDPGSTSRPECSGRNNSDTDPLSPCRANCALRSCGDGALDAGEQCEGSDLGGQSCETLGFHASADSTLACSAFCTYDVSACGGGRCGDGIVNGDETCDGAQYASSISCESLGFYDADTDHRSCTPLCTFDDSLCQHYCGDGVRDAGEEQCDGTDLGGQTCDAFGFYRGTLGCTSFCAFDSSACSGRCGDNVVDGGEYCDGPQSAVAGYCTDFGYSTGQLTCSRLCGPAFASCRPPSVWTPVMSARMDFIEIAPAPGDKAWIIAENEVLLFSSTATIDASFPTTSILTDGSSFGTLVAVSTESATIRRYRSTGFVDEIAVPNGACKQIVLTSETSLACIRVAGVQWWSEATGWGAVLTAPLRNPTEGLASGSEVYFTDFSGAFYDALGGVYRATPSGVVPLAGAVRNIETLNVTSTGIYGGRVYGGGQYGGGTGGEIYQPNDMGVVQGGLMLPRPNSDGLYGAAEAGGIPMWQMAYTGQLADAGSLRRTGSVDGSSMSCRRMVTTGGTSLCLSPAEEYGSIKGRLMRFAGATMGTAQPMPSIAVGDLNDAYIDEAGHAYFASRTGVTSRWPEQSWAPTITGATFDTIVGRKSSEILLVGWTEAIPPALRQRDQLALWDGLSFSTAVVGPNITAAAPVGGSEIAVSTTVTGGCNVSLGPVTALVTALSGVPCVSSFWTSPTGAVWSASRAEVRRVRPNTQPVPLTQSGFATTASISGVDDTHIWVAASDTIWFYNGVSWVEQLKETGNLFDWVYAARSDLVIATAGSVTWVYGKAQKWTKLRLPSDPTALVKPMLTSWGVFFRTPNASASYAVWQQDWL